MWNVECGMVAASRNEELFNVECGVWNVELLRQAAMRNYLMWNVECGMLND